MFDSWHSGGEQAIDLSRPSHPRQAGWFSPTPLPSVANDDPALSRGPNKVVTFLEGNSDLGDAGRFTQGGW